ncbi:hypothetical protein KGF56_004883 [Candida oxycetoniae]|uniref:RING-type domain-containing protein n=1 Tax=Candida oxycetoniae TaxID=497107 RepID=A0AAI9SS93_9ASCO|nr:uncharacterized protein KGF56_004883 [Candida oxycetoniae]KAI3402313.2 hypothetical protein KGF56_004883 [Candida oxycetoniae]
MNNSTVLQHALEPADTAAAANPIFKLASSAIDAVWEQSVRSELNKVSWNRFGAISQYCCSIYGLSCLVMAFVLNRTLVMASTNNIHNQQMAINRQRRNFQNGNLFAAYKSATAMKKLSILFFRMGMVVILLYQLYTILVVLKLHQNLGLAETSVIQWFYRLIPSRFFTYDAAHFESNKYMKTPSKQVMIGPTSDMYWPIFLTFCLSSFIETFIASIQGEKPFTESGTTIFEHSLAFQEFSSNAAFFFSNSYHYKRPTEEVLVTSLFSILNHLNIHIGAIVNNNRLRLIPSTIIGTGFLGYFVTSIIHKQMSRFPVILISTLIPQLLIVFIVLISSAIFFTAVVVNGCRFQGLNYASLFAREDRNQLEEGDNNDDAFGNELDSPMSNLNISLTDDFYTALLNLGVLAITSAGKSSYITELSLVTLDHETWVERSIWQRLKYFSKSKYASMDASRVFAEETSVLGYDNIISKPNIKSIASSGAFSSGNENSLQENTQYRNSVFEKRFRYCKKIVIDFCQLIYGLVVDKFMLQLVPELLSFVWSSHKDESNSNSNSNSSSENLENLERRRLKTPKFLKKHMRKNKVGYGGAQASTAKNKNINVNLLSSEELESNYASLLLGADFGETDNSEDYIFQTKDDSEDESDVDYDETTYGSVFGGAIKQYRNPREEADVRLPPMYEIFDPQGLKEVFSTSSDLHMIRDHFNYEGRLTRSKYQKLHTSEENVKEQFDGHEGQKLIDLIIMKRQASKLESQDKKEQLSSERSLDCVICQTNMREIITWPCKCFAICESCRLSLVSKGIEGCVCCRSEVKGVSKVFIP